MSEPVKHSEIEDVLSSIRRLVSDADRLPLRAERPKADAGLERLVLTDELRVSEAPDTEEEAKAADEPEDGAEAAPADEPEVTAETEVADEPEAAEEAEMVDDSTDLGVLPSDFLVLDDAVDHFEFTPRRKKPGRAVGHFGDDAVVPKAEGDQAGAKQPDEAEHGVHSDAQEPKAADQSAVALEPADVTDSKDAPEPADAPESASAPVEDDLEAADADGEVAATDAEPGSQQAGAEERPMFERFTSSLAEEKDDEAPWANPETTLYEAAGIASDADESPYGNPDDIRPLTEKIAALEEVIGQTEDQWEPDDPGADEYAGTEVDTLDWGDTRTDDEAVAEESAAEADAPVEAEDPGLADAPAEPEDLEEAVEAAAPTEVEEPVEDAAPVADKAPTEVEEPVEDAAPAVADALVEDEAPAGADDLTETAVPEQADAPVQEEAASEAEADEPDAPEDAGDEVDTAVPMFTHTAREDIADRPEPATVALEPDALASEEPVMDEAALRQLVAEIVREELQGVLGERITRNVRKLVRREIHRALSLQELE